jgi:hypothetical protein
MITAMIQDRSGISQRRDPESERGYLSLAWWCSSIIPAGSWDAEVKGLRDRGQPVEWILSPKHQTTTKPARKKLHERVPLL